jgi:hypothetical protein
MASSIVRLKKISRNKIAGLFQGIILGIGSFIALYLIFQQIGIGLNLEQYSGFAVAGSISTILALIGSLMIIGLNLDERIPQSLIDEFIFDNRETWRFLGLLFGFIFVLSAIGYLEIFNPYWNSSALGILVVAIGTTVYFFLSLSEKTSKEAIYRHHLIKNIGKSERLKQIEETTNDSFDLRKNNGKYILGDIGNIVKSESNHTIRISPNELSRLRVNEKKLKNVLNSYSSDIQYGEFYFPGTYVTNKGFLSRPVFFKLNTNNSSVEKKIKSCFSYEELEWYKVWKDCVFHSVRTNEAHLEYDFEFINGVIEESSEPQGKILGYAILDDLKREIFVENDGSLDPKYEDLLSELIGVCYKIGLDRQTANPELVMGLIDIIGDLSRFYSQLSGHNPRYKTSILYIKEQLKYSGVLSDFWKADEDELDDYNALFEKSISNSYSIIQSTIENNYKNPQLYRRYLINQISDFLTLLEGSKYRNQRERRYTDPEKYKEIKDREEFIDQFEKQIKTKCVDLGFGILFYIDRNLAPENWKDLGFELIDKGDLDNYISTHSLSMWALKNKITSSSGFTGSQFPKFEYTAIYILQKHIKGENYKINSNHENISSALSKMDYRDIKKWMNADKEEFITSKRSLIRELKERK